MVIQAMISSSQKALCVASFVIVTIIFYKVKNFPADGDWFSEKRVTL
jgi:hypothetical protein